MARIPRIVVPGQALHIIQRGNNRQAVFYRVEDYCFYLETLQQAAVLHGCAIHAYVLMTNHVHLLATPECTEGPSRMIQAIGRRYVHYVNRCYRRTGTLWEGRFKSALINLERYFFTCVRYIELNPVRAGMVEHPGDYRWSSYRFNATGHQDAVITPHPLYEQLGSDTGARRSAYRGLFAGHIDEVDLDRLRKGTDKGEVIGNDRFREQMQALMERRVVRSRHGGDRRSAAFFKGSNFKGSDH